LPLDFDKKTLIIKVESFRFGLSLFISNNMKKIILIAIVSTLSFTSKAQSKTESLDKVLQSITKVLKELDNSADLPGPAKVNVTFKTEVTKSTNAGINILIFNFGKKWMRQQSNEVAYNYSLSGTNEKAERSLEEELAKAISGAIAQARTVQNENLSLNNFYVQISFVLESETSAGGEYQIIPLPITPSLGRSWKKKAIHTIKVTFED